MFSRKKKKIVINLFSEGVQAEFFFTKLTRGPTSCDTVPLMMRRTIETAPAGDKCKKRALYIHKTFH